MWENFKENFLNILFIIFTALVIIVIISLIVGAIIFAVLVIASMFWLFSFIHAAWLGVIIGVIGDIILVALAITLWDYLKEKYGW